MEEEVIKKIALASAKQRLSPQTGFIQYWSEDPTLPRQDTISLLENFIYAYALFRCKTVENIQEGKLLLEKLLAFEVAGNFPVYLHEFPRCRDAKLSSQIFPVIFYLLRDFPLALGEVWTRNLRSLSERIQDFLAKQEQSPSIAPRSPEDWGKLCIAAQMAGDDFSQEKTLWNSSLGVFIGECKERWQDGYEPQVTLFDLFMESFPRRSAIDHPVHLKAALVHPWKKKAPKSQEGAFVALVEEGQRQCLTFYWGGLDRLHSMVLESKKGTWSIKESVNEWICTYTYDELVPTEESAVEWAFYLDDAGTDPDKGHVIKIEGHKATMFHPEDEVVIFSKGHKISFQVIVDPSQGLWTGHISKGDRSFQKNKKLQYGGYDWKLGWRTVRRNQVASLTLVIRVQ